MKILMRNGRVRRSENPFWATAKKERVLLSGTDQRITSGPAAKRLHSKAGYMAAPERFAESQIPLAPRAPSIHGCTRTLRRKSDSSCTAGAVHTWPMTSLAAVQQYTCSWGNRRHGGGAAGFTAARGRI